MKEVKPAKKSPPGRDRSQSHSPEVRTREEMQAGRGGGGHSRAGNPLPPGTRE